jgi:hypothetical protein
MAVITIPLPLYRCERRYSAPLPPERHLSVENIVRKFPIAGNKLPLWLLYRLSCQTVWT